MRLVLPVFFFFFFFSLVPALSATTKKGVCFGSDPFPDTAKCSDIKVFDVSWYYNWGLTPSCQAGIPGVEFIPMIWNAAALPISSLPPGSDWLLGFNEPNYRNQANMLPADAAKLWPQLEATGRRLVGPGLADCGPGLGGDCTYSTIDWYREFFGNCTGCRVDAVGLHLYYCSSRDMMNKITALYELTQRPVWLTEFACNAPSTQSHTTTFAQELLPQLEASNIVQRYSWFLNYCDGCGAGDLLYSSLLVDQTGKGSLTPVGTFYSGFDSTNPYMASSTLGVYIDCGAFSPSVDSHGIAWLNDESFSIAPPSAAVASAQMQGGVANVDPYVLKSARSSAINISYSIPVMSVGEYNVSLYFSEGKFATAGARIFSISIQGTVVQSKFDIFAAAKAANAGTIFSRIVPIVSSNSIISIVLVSVTGDVIINGLSVVPVSLSNVMPKIEPTFINVGGGGKIDAAGNKWLAGAEFTSGGNSANVTSIIADSTSDLQFVYQSNQWGAFTLTVPAICSGSYTVELLFAETYWGEKGSRLFDVSIQGVKVLSNFDIYDEGGSKNVAVDANITNVIVKPTLPFIVITTAIIKDNPLISGVILRPAGAPETQTPSVPVSQLSSALHFSPGALIGGIMCFGFVSIFQTLFF